MASRKCACCLVVLSAAVLLVGLTGGWAPPSSETGLTPFADEGYAPVKKTTAWISDQPGEPAGGGFQTFGVDDCNSNGIDDAVETGVASVEADDCADAQPIRPGITYVGSTAGATNDGSATCGDSATSPDVWFRYTPATGGTLSILMCGSSYDTVLSLHTGCPGTTDNEVSCNDDTCQCGTGAGNLPATPHSRVTIHIEAGTEYFVRIAGFAGETGDFNLLLVGPELADDCNDNEIPDDCDLADGFSDDCNTNAGPDECDVHDGFGNGDSVLFSDGGSFTFSGIANQIGGLTPAELADDFVTDSRVDLVTARWQQLELVDWVWTGEVFVALYPDIGGAPHEEPIRTQTIGMPDVTRTIFLDRAASTTDVYEYVATLNIDVPYAGTWWISLVPVGSASRTFWTVNQREGQDPAHPIVMTEAFFRSDFFGQPTWGSTTEAIVPAIGMAYELSWNVADCNENDIPDECELDTNEDGIPDDCQDCNTNGTLDPSEEGFADCNTNLLADFCDLGFGSAQDCDADGVLDVCEFVDCNTNNVLDSCDVGFGSAVDCDTNGTPDECGPDCNTNNISDLCDLDEGLDTDCDTNSVPDQCEDCNSNNLSDACETAFGTTADCDGNGVPDSCDVALFDCNLNGVPDSCDANGGTSTDCNENAAPDECEIPAEDDCEDAHQITSGIVYKANILDATAEAGQPLPTCGGLVDLPDKWWAYTPQASGDVTVTMCGPADPWDTVISVYEGPCVGAEVACGDDECGEPGSGNFGVVTFAGVLGETYLIRVNPFDGGTDLESGDYQIQIIGPPGSADTGDENGNDIPDVCDFADCNTNLNDDLEDIAEGDSEDCNTNLVPDECDDNPDCNGNGELDACEEDCNDNGVPDDCEPIALPLAANDTDVLIPDGGGPAATSDIVIGDSGTLADVNVHVDVQHTWISDVDFSVSHGALTVLLAADNGDDGDNYTGTVFDEDSGTPIEGATAPFTGTFNPEGDLDVFNVTEMSGTWTLTISDDSPFDTGTLLSWALALSVGGLTDCNTNGVLDECDIADGNSVDGNGNGIPDECEAVLCATCAGDTNGDGLTDGDDIAGFVGCVITGVGCGCTDTDGDGATADVDTADDVAAFVTLLLTDDDLVCGP